MLDIKGGELPKELPGTVQPTLDLVQFYLLSKRISQVFTGVVAVAGFNQFVDSIVPVGELWYIWAFGITANMGAGAQFTGRPSANYGANTFAIGPQISAAATTQDRGFSNVPFILNPGESLGFICTTVALGPTIVGAVAVSKLRV